MTKNIQEKLQENTHTTEPVKIYINNNSQHYTTITQEEAKTTTSPQKSYQPVVTTQSNGGLSEYDRAMTEYIFDTISE